MPGYLTSMMVLIESDRWLFALQDAIKKVKNPSPLEKKLGQLAGEVRDALRYGYEPAVANSPVLPPLDVAQIKNGIGGGLTRYAYAGALGSDFPAAGNILALNHGWVSDTMHKGSPRRAWRDAGTTRFVLDSLAKRGDNLKTNQPILAEYKKTYKAMMIGHLASIATHIVVQPFINEWVWKNGDATAAGQQTAWYVPWPLGQMASKPVNRLRFSVQIDAKLAKTYFRGEGDGTRDGLHSGASWTEYLPGDGKAIDFICANYLQAFTSTYDKTPKEAMCALPSEETLAGKYAGLKDLLAASLPLKQKLAQWSGYDNLVADLTPQDNAALKTAFDSSDALKDFSDLIQEDYICSAPTLDHDFLKDGYKNTRNWALDAGYDHAPWVISTIMSTVLSFTAWDPLPTNSDSFVVNLILKLVGFGVIRNVWDATHNFGNSDDVKKENLQCWLNHGLANEIIWFDMFDNAYGSLGFPLWAFNSVLSGVPSTPLDGIFGQNGDSLKGVSWLPHVRLPLVNLRIPYPNLRKLFILYNDIFSPLVFFPLILNGKGLVDWYRKPGWRWVFYGIVNVGFDFLEEHFIADGNTEKGIQGDAIGRRIWYLRSWLTITYVLSSAVAFGVKAGSSSKDDDTPDVRDYFLGQTFLLITIPVIVWSCSGFEGALLKALTGVDWPSSDTNLVDDLMPEGADPVTKQTIIRGDTEHKLPIAYFPSLGLIHSGDPDYYPEADLTKIKWDDRFDEDEKARMNGRHTSTNTYALGELFDYARMFAGILSMAMINYDKPGSDRTKTREIFKDWNLDFRAEDEWTSLVESPDIKPGGSSYQLGLLKAVKEWFTNLLADPTKVSRDAVLAQLATLNTTFGLPAGAEKRPAAATKKK